VTISFLALKKQETFITSKKIHFWLKLQFSLHEKVSGKSQGKVWESQGKVRE